MSQSQNRNIVFYFPLIYLIGADIVSALTDDLALTQTRNADVWENTWTNKIRTTYSLLIFDWLPFYVMAMWINSDRRLLISLRAIVYSGVILAILALPLGVLGWDIYRAISPVIGAEYRGGFLRLGLSLAGPTKLGFYLTIVVAAMLGTMLYIKSGILRYCLITVCVLPALYFTGSRGAWIGFVLLFIGFVYYKMPSHSRYLSALFFVVVVSAVSFTFISDTKDPGMEIESVDSTGTFDYRKRLAEVELELIKEYPWFGHPNPFQTPEMEELRQGQGIIDPVNAILTMALTEGLIYVGFFLIIVIGCLRGCARYVNVGYIQNKRSKIYCGACLSAIIISLMVQWIFTSYSGIRVTYFWIILGIATGVKFGWGSTSESVTYRRDIKLMDNPNANNI